MGYEIVRLIDTCLSILMKNHGTVALGILPEAVVKTTGMVKDLACPVFNAAQQVQPDEIPAEEVARIHRRYLE